MWPWRRREPRRVVLQPGGGHAAHEDREQAHQRLMDAIQRSADVDRLANELRRAMGIRR